MEGRVMAIDGSRDRLTWEEEKAIHTELLAARAAEEAKERARAYAAVSAALASYRWWGWTNIVNTFRLFIQRCRRARPE